MMHVVTCAGVEIIDTQHFIAAFQQPVAKMRSDKTCTAGDEDATFGQHGGVLPQNGPQAELIFLHLFGHCSIFKDRTALSTFQIF